MSSISKASSRSSSSGFSSITHDGFLPTVNLQTVLDIQRMDINARTIFCGEQDCRLNELRRQTGAIIDLNVVQDTRRPFERVNWTISHRNNEIRDFVARRLNYWMQQTQIACDIAYEDALFHEAQHEKQAKSRVPPPLTSANFGRRYRTRSLTQSDSISYLSKRDSVPSTPLSSNYKRQQPFTGLLGRTLLHMDRERVLSSYQNGNVEMTETEINELVESAKWAGVLSDASDQELNDNRVCFADTISLSKLAEILRNNELKLTSDIIEVETVLQQSTVNISNREQIRQFNGQTYWFHRILLDNHIQFPVGISPNVYEARRLAYRHMLDVCLSDSGVKMKMLTGQRVKVVKGPKLNKPNRLNTDEFDVNATYISTAELSCLSHCNMI